MITIRVSTFLLLLLIVLCIGIVFGVALMFTSNKEDNDRKEKTKDGTDNDWGA